MKFYIDDENCIVCEYDSEIIKYYSSKNCKVEKIALGYTNIDEYNDMYKIRELTGIELALYNIQIQKLIEAGDD